MKRILIIEDDLDIAELERDYLQLNGYKADIAGDGLQGLKKAVSGMYDVVVVDPRIKTATKSSKESGDTDHSRIGQK
jgi:DNA-binding response OmpR family regulator